MDGQFNVQRSDATTDESCVDFYHDGDDQELRTGDSDLNVFNFKVSPKIKMAYMLRKTEMGPIHDDLYPWHGHCILSV